MTSDVQITDGGIDIVSGQYDTDDGIAMFVAGEPHPRVKITPQGIFSSGTGSVPPSSIEVPAPARLGADWCITADSAVGVTRWADQGRDGADVLNGSAGAAPLPADAWPGLRIVGGLSSEVGASWPNTLDIRWYGRLLPRGKGNTSTFDEVLLVTIDEDEDYLEPAFVTRPDGVHLGLDLLLDGESSERHWLSAGPLPDPHGDHEYRITMDGTNVRSYIDGALFGSPVLVSSLPQQDPGTTVSAPYTLAAPPPGSAIEVLRNSNCANWLSLLTEIDGVPLHRIDADDATDGATTVTTDGEVWGHDAPGSFGLIISAPATNRIIKGGTPGWGVDAPDTFDIPADQSATWAVRLRAWPEGSQGGAIWNRGAPFSFISGGVGWLFGSLSPLGLGYGLAVGAEGIEAQVDAGSRPFGTHTAVIVLDRAEDELRFYINGELVDTADASTVGDVSTTDPMSIMAFGAGDAEWFAYWSDTALDVDEILTLGTTD